MLRGTAAPPITVRSRSRAVAGPVEILQEPSQMVGTPSATVTCSDSSRSHNVSPSLIFGPGSTSLAPVIAHEYGMPRR